MAATAALAVASSWELCDKYKSYPVKIKDVEVLPDPVVSGQDAAFVVPASTMSLCYGITSLCIERWTKCPIAAGDFVLNSTQALPGFTPSGKYKIRMQIACAKHPVPDRLATIRQVIKFRKSNKKGSVLEALPELTASSCSFCLGCSSWAPCDVKVVVDPAITGEDVEFQVTGSSSARLASGKLAITVYFHGIFVRREIYDLCQKTSCPVEAGNFVLKSAQNLPSVTPSGAYRLKLEMLDPKNKLLACAMVNFDIVRPNPLTPTTSGKTASKEQKLSFANIAKLDFSSP
ncbi:uncharacterized protein LOC9630451 [Selaginella moellendorffii]|uniref:uncharacterized protein LOC9630451 n=1 Tax=Selaginella moellendorffii TaxID=88036 RepID=UPI000D1C23D7|nr:uncharacterized protein LOC9630451 [Selaginella moellendorffii]|eukprot:XP_024536129.1 uncharacterized protein LOC9630451 [Selaginella moellendorffii]